MILGPPHSILRLNMCDGNDRWRLHRRRAWFLRRRGGRRIGYEPRECCPRGLLHAYIHEDEQQGDAYK